MTSTLEHTTRKASLMNVNTWRNYDYPTKFDKSEIKRRYPK